MVDHIQYHLPDWMAGTEELSFEEEAVYRKLCDFIYLLDNHLKDDDQHNAKRLKLSTRRYRTIKGRLLETGKIEVVDGWIANDRAAKELEKVHEKSEKSRKKAAKKQRNFSTKPLKTNKTSAANSETSKPVKSKTPPKPPADSQPNEVPQAVKAWNQLAGDIGLSKVQTITDARRTACRARLCDCGGMPGWLAALEKIRGSPFLRGETGGDWKATFDFLVSQRGFVKIIEGSYDGGKSGSTPGNDGAGAGRPSDDELTDKIARGYARHVGAGPGGAEGNVRRNGGGNDGTPGGSGNVVDASESGGDRGAVDAAVRPAASPGQRRDGFVDGTFEPVS